MKYHKTCHVVVKKTVIKRVACVLCGCEIKVLAEEPCSKKGSRDEAVKSHSTILHRLRRQISLDYYTIPPATQAIKRAEKNSILIVLESTVALNPIDKDTSVRTM